MKKLTMFYLENCPYCRNTQAALAALRELDPAYGQVEIEMIEEA
jgi:glutaredoxin